MKHQENSLKYCIDTVDKEDHDLYTVLLLMPDQMQDRLFCLAAFDIELSTILGGEGDPMLARIKLQWWHGRLEEVKNGRPLAANDHQILTALGSCGILSDKEWVAGLQTLIEAKTDLTEKGGSYTLDQLLDRCQQTTGTLYTLMVQTSTGLIDLPFSPDLKGAATDLGTIVGLSRNLRAFIFEFAKQSGQSGTNHDPNFQKTCESLVAEIRDRVKSLRKKRAIIPAKMRGIFQMITFCERQIMMMEKAEFQARNIVPTSGQLGSLLRLTCRHLLGKF